jgi:hypothetical protein
MTRHAFTTAAVAVCAVCALSGTARAGSYQVVSCLDSPTGTVNNAWQNMGSTTPALFTSQRCEPAMTFDPGPNVESVSGLAAAITITGTPPAGSEAYWRLTAPPGAAITNITYRRYTGKNDTEYFVPFLRTQTGQIIDGNCTIGPPLDYWCAVGSTASSGAPLAATVARANIPVPSASRLEFGVRCNAPQGACAGGAFLHKMWASMFGSTVTITEHAPPAVSADSATGAWAAPGWLSGTQTVRAATATDPVGIKRLRLLIDGQPAATSDRACDYTFVVPCPNASGATLTFNANTIPEGQHTLTLEATDAANNTSTVSRQVLIDGTAPHMPQITTTGSIVAPGQPWNVTVQATGGHGSPIAGLRYRICRSDGTCGPVQNSTVTDRVTGTFAEPGGYEVRVWARDQAGNEDEATAASASFWVQRPVSPPTPPTVGPTPPPAIQPGAPPTIRPLTPPARQPVPAPASTPSEPGSEPIRPRLRITALTARKRTVTLRVRANIAVTATLQITAHGRTVRRQIILDEGTTSLRVTLRRPVTAGARVTARVRSASDEDLLAATATRTTRSQ